jgi:hypothetical protein
VIPGGHIGGLPVEETLAAMSPALGVGFGVLALTFRERLPEWLSRRFRGRGAAAAETVPAEVEDDTTAD